MKSVITPSNLCARWKPGEVWDHAATLAPFFAVHSAYGVRRNRVEFWRWEIAAVVECLGAAWNMTGRWQARRVVSVSRRRFDQAVVAIVPKLARTLNALEVASLADIGGLSTTKYRRAAMALQTAVQGLSELRPTTEIEPVFGSKVLHHFFPSVVPVYDRQYIRLGVLRLPEFLAFVQNNEDGWLLPTADEASGGRMREYHRYFAFCTAQVHATTSTRLRHVRRQFGDGFADLAPRRMVEDKDGLVWRLDAKLTEYCLVGRAAQEGLLT